MTAFPAKINYVTGDILTAAQMVDIGNLLNLTDTSLSPGAWTTYTPTVAATSGTLTTTTGAMRYKYIGKTLMIEFNVTITNIGTGSGVITLSSPVAINQNGMGACREMTGSAIGGTVHAAAGGSLIYLYPNSGSYITNGFQIFGSVVCEVG